MPNWIDTDYTVVLPTNKVDRFLGYFLRSDETDQLRGRFFYRTFIDTNSIHRVETQPGITCLTFYARSAWSLGCILEEHTPSDDIYTKCVDLEWVCKDCGVLEFKAQGDETGNCFREYVEWDPDNGLSHDSHSISIYMCDKCNTYGIWEDYPEDIDRTVCPECGEKLEEDDEDETSESV